MKSAEWDVRKSKPEPNEKPHHRPLPSTIASGNRLAVDIGVVDSPLVSQHLETRGDIFIGIMIFRRMHFNLKY